ncbi:sulfatase [Catenovulum adriaticum]|uniref:Sulfatase n=1 Tax=Catenovulum adriaticum TaxID=2984846 RepID=A0ABY7AR62_9ALTE|nr:sulfatase [Catenovulum sp. TS8]WAJ71738.1 sulfatase [Catenovulum sp. TS8]
MKIKHILFSSLLPVSLTLISCGEDNATTSTQVNKPIMVEQNTQNQPYNVIMIAVDDLNNWAGYLGGPAKTPNLDKLAAQSSTFTNAYSVVPACNPSRVAVMTGQRPETTGAYLNETNFRDVKGGDKRVTIPQYFAKQGYKTSAAGKIFHHPRGQKNNPAPMSDPISWQSQFAGPTGTGGDKEYLNHEGWAKWHGGIEAYQGLPIIPYIRKHGIWGPIKQTDEETGDYKTANYCANYLRQSHNKPFFLACGIFRPHSPQLAPQKYFDMYPLESIKLPAVPAEDMQDIPAIAQNNWSSGFAKLVMDRPDEWKRAVQGYLASTSFADAMIGHILQAWDNSEYADNTILVLWGDHGFQLGHKNRWEKFTLWKQGSHTPFIIKAPGKQAAMINKPVTLLNVYPTLLELANLPAKPDLDGVSLTPLMDNAKADWQRPAVLTYQQDNNAIIFENWNFIQYKDGSQELYNQTTDPHEYNNLIGQPQYAEVIEKLSEWLPEVKIAQTEYRPGG